MYFSELNLTNRTVSSSFKNYVQSTGSILVDGVGNSIYDLSSSIVSASYSLTASYALNGGVGGPTISASWASASISSSYTTTSSFALKANTAISASWASASISSSISSTATSSSYAVTASYALNGSSGGPTISASWASSSLSSSRLFGNSPSVASNYIVTSSYSVIQTNSYNLSSSDNGKLIIMNVPTGAGVYTAYVGISSTLPQGFACSILQYGTAQIIISGSDEVQILNRSNLSASFGQYSIISLIQVISTGSYILQGDIG
jgi:hypothetical protein